jgi:hypothetical protein
MWRLTKNSRPNLTEGTPSLGCTIGQSLHAQTVRRHVDTMFLMERLVFAAVVVFEYMQTFSPFLEGSMVELGSRL